ncbi:hypothetical protein [Weissella confusa]|uniref:hypothetical protein n=1 Tax=Weissella confusa TaxID=1583 RepID=UPI0013E091A1|nr:hypothetical protein [Weissella confusa]QIE78467.1 hypothetical protein G4V46_04095 [Weissella confusa]
MANNESIFVSIGGTDVETENRVKNDRLLLNAIEIERDERVEATREIYDKLRKHEIVLSVVIGVEIGLLIAMMLIVWQTLS